MLVSKKEEKYISSLMPHMKDNGCARAKKMIREKSEKRLIQTKTVSHRYL
jgi:hypothetical protein